MAKKNWTIEQDNIIRKIYPEQGPLATVKALSGTRSYDAVIKRASVLKVKSGRKKKKTSMLEEVGESNG